MNKATNRGVLGSVQSVLYVYGQLKPNISVCEILNRNRSKWLETVDFGGISILAGFGRFRFFKERVIEIFKTLTLIT